MDPDTQKMIRETLRLSRENNEMLHKMRSAQKRAAFWRFVKFIITAGLLLGAYYLIAPLIENLTDAYSGFMDQIQKVGEARDRLPF
jgi:hypothetical protein